MKHLVGSKKVRTFASAFEQKTDVLSFEHKERVLWKTYINREVVQEASRWVLKL